MREVSFPFDYTESQRTRWQQHFKTKNLKPASRAASTDAAHKIDYGAAHRSTLLGGTGDLCGKYFMNGAFLFCCFLCFIRIREETHEEKHVRYRWHTQSHLRRVVPQ